MARILIVEDEKPISDLIRFNLSLVGHECKQVFDGETAIAESSSGIYNLILLDVMLPKLSGFDILPQLKQTPIILVTAKAAIEDKLKGLRLGADDYLVKPFEMLELVERVNTVLRRTKADVHTFAFDDIIIDFRSQKVYKKGTEIPLKPKEYRLFETLIQNRNLALSREKLIRLVWDFDYEGDTRTVDVHIQKLRQKLGIASRLQTVYKTGYRLEV